MLLAFYSSSTWPEGNVCVLPPRHPSRLFNCDDAESACLCACSLMLTLFDLMEEPTGATKCKRSELGEATKVVRLVGERRALALRRVLCLSVASEALGGDEVTCDARGCCRRLRASSPTAPSWGFETGRSASWPCRRP